MRTTPRLVLEKITDFIAAWAHMRPAKSFSGLSLDQCKEEVQPSLDARADIADAEVRLQAATKRRETADENSMRVLRRVVRGIQGDPEEGEDGELYAAMGFVRESRRSSGLTRRRKDQNEKDQEEVTSKEDAAS